MLRFVSTLEYCPADSTVFLVSPFDIRRHMVAPRLVPVGYSLQISNERRLRTHATHSPSNRRLFLGRSLCRGTRKSTQRNDRTTFSKWVELRNVYQLLSRYSSNRSLITLHSTPPYTVSPFDIHRPSFVKESREGLGPGRIKWRCTGM